MQENLTERNANQAKCKKLLCLLQSINIPKHEKDAVLEERGQVYAVEL